MHRVAIALLLCIAWTAAQSPREHTPLDGRNFEAILSNALPSHEDIAFRKKLAVTVQILPPFGVESRLALSCDLETKCTLARSVLSISRGQTAGEAVSQGPSVADVVRMNVESKTETVALANREAAALVSNLWKAIRAHAEIAEKDGVALASEKNEIEMVLDPTTYQISVSQVQMSLDVNIPGPDADEVSTESQQEPLLTWIFELSKLLDERLRQ